MWALALVAAVLAALPLAAEANGRVLTLTQKTAGPYLIELGTIPDRPVVGRLHMTMRVSDVVTSTALFDADVRVTGQGPETEEGHPPHIGPLVAQNIPADPAFYDVNTSVDREGTWVFTVEVNGRLGQGSADFPIEVRQASPVTGIITLITLLAFVAIIGISIRAYLRDRGKGKKSRRR